MDQDDIDLEPTDDSGRSRWRRLAAYRPRGRFLGWGALLLFLLLLLYYPLGAWWVENIDDDPNFAAATKDAQTNPASSRAVDVAIALIDREVNQHRWVSNDPFFLPGSILDNMPNFQQGILQALWRFALEMTDQIGRTRGSSSADPDLEQATGLLKYPPNVWVWNPSVSLMPSATSESQYRAALRALRNYNLRLANNSAVYEKRADNLLVTLDRIAADLGSASAQLEQHIADHSGDWIDLQADDIFFNIKGRLYTYGLLLRALGEDFAPMIQERDMRNAWDQTTESLLKGASIHPLLIMNGATDALIEPNHLANEGFYLLRARTQLRELTNILQK